MKNNFKKIISLLLIIGMNWSAVSLIAGTDAYFHDTEISESNTLTAGVLDFELSGKGFHSYGLYQTANQTQTESVEVINNADNLEFEYAVSVDVTTDTTPGTVNSAFCDSLVLSVSNDDGFFYSGSLSGLYKVGIDAPSPATPDKWDFQITKGSGLGTCEFDFVFKARQENLTYGEGFFDEERIGNVISTLPDCGPAGHLVINEIQIAGATATDEFVELYNPTNAPISLDGWRLSKKTAAGNETNLLTSFPNLEIPAYGYFLIAHNDYVGSVAEDVKYSTTQSIAANNTVILYSDAGSTIVDKVGYGVVADYETVGDITTAPYPVTPLNNHSIERGLNGYDDNNNAKDFTTKTNPTPTNSGGAGKPEIVINEFLASGDDYPDFVEIYNGSSATTLASGWSVKVDGGTPIIIGYALSPGEFAVIETDLNANDAITLYDNSSPPDEIDKISYYGADVATMPDNSFARIPDGSSNWVDPKPTPGETNVTDENLESAGLDLGDLALMENDKEEVGISENSEIEETPAAESIPSSSQEENDKKEIGISENSEIEETPAVEPTPSSSQEENNSDFFQEGNDIDDPAINSDSEEMKDEESGESVDDPADDSDDSDGDGDGSDDGAIINTINTINTIDDADIDGVTIDTIDTTNDADIDVADDKEPVVSDLSPQEGDGAAQGVTTTTDDNGLITDDFGGGDDNGGEITDGGEEEVDLPLHITDDFDGGDNSGDGNGSDGEEPVPDSSSNGGASEVE